MTTRPAHRSTPQPRSPSRDTGDGAHSTLSPQRSTQGGRDGQHGPSYRKLRPEGGEVTGRGFVRNDTQVPTPSIGRTGEAGGREMARLLWPPTSRNWMSDLTTAAHRAFPFPEHSFLHTAAGRRLGGAAEVPHLQVESRGSELHHPVRQ